MRNPWTPKPADRVVRHPRQEEIQPVRLTVTTRRVPSRFVASPLLIVYAFIVLIAVGTILLLMPFANTAGGFTPLLDALFTSTSAVTVTGLVTQHTATFWTRPGQIIIMVLMYAGGLGFMTIATFLLVLIGQRVTIAQRLAMREGLLVNQLGGLARLTVGIVVAATLIQLVGFLGLFARFYFLYPPAEAVYQSVFHSISAFNSAGFLAFNEEAGLAAFRGDFAIIGVMSFLIFIGAISYWVIIDLVRVRKFSLFTLNTKIVLVMTAALTLLGFVGFFVLEYRNPETIGPLPIGEKAMVSFFQALSSRTAGFSLVGLDVARAQTNFLTTGLMFIGGASASVAGDIKVNTLALILLAIMATVKGRTSTTAFGREIPRSLVQRAFVVGAISIAFVFLVILLLSISERGADFLDIVFEAISAFGTVGLSTGLTPDLSSSGQLIIIATMFLGKLGPLTVGLTMVQRRERDLYRYPQERVTIG